MIQIIALLYASTNGIEGLREYESQVIPLLREHGGQLISASSKDNKSEDEPDEIHIIQFPDAKNFEAYKNDQRVVNLASIKSERLRKVDLFITNSFHQY
jgi:uncharacterized protein (DUF1330 family)